MYLKKKQLPELTVFRSTQRHKLLGVWPNTRKEDDENRKLFSASPPDVNRRLSHGKQTRKNPRRSSFHQRARQQCLQMLPS
jgi:hypothetical protein